MMDYLLEERKFIGNISKFHGLCQTFKLTPRSNFDPVYKDNNELKKVNSTLSVIYDKHSIFYSKLNSGKSLLFILHDTFNDNELLSAYQILLASFSNLVFSNTTTTFRNEDNPTFMTLIFNVYRHLKELLDELLEDNYSSLEALNGLTISFEKYFTKRYIQLYSKSLYGGNVRNLLSHSNSLTQFQNISHKSVLDNHYLKLTSTQLGYNKLLVEIVELSTHELAIFKIDSGRVLKTYHVDSPQLINDLLDERFSVLNMRRSLLFVPIKPNELKITEFTKNGVKLETITGNNISILMRTENLLAWESNWKNKIENYFGSSHSNISLKKSSKLQGFDNFLQEPSKNKKTIEKPGELLPSPPITTSNNFLDSNIESTRSLCSDQDGSTRSLAEIESLSYEKLIELDNSISIELSPVINASPRQKVVRSVSETFTLQKVDPRFSSENETSEIESIISDLRKDDINDTVFNPSSEFYIPSLTQKKSNSILSIFSGKHRTNSSIFNGSNNFNNISNSSSLFDTPNSQTSFFKEPEVAPPVKAYIQGLTNDELVGSTCVFKNENVHLSVWDNNSWNRLYPQPLYVSILQMSNNKTVIIAYSHKEKNECQLIANINSHCVCSRSTAQDIQVVMPRNVIIDHTMNLSNSKLTSITMSFRCRQTDNLYSIFQDSVNGTIKRDLTSLRNVGTLSTSTSSSSNQSDSLFSTAASGTSISTGKRTISDSKDFSYHLLIPNMKIRYHTLGEESKKWQLQSMGMVNIHSQEYSNVRTGIRFEYKANVSGSQTMHFHCHLGSIKRLKKTGIMIHNKSGYQLLEFTNQTVTEQAFKLMHGLF